MAIYFLIHQSYRFPTPAFRSAAAYECPIYKHIRIINLPYTIISACIPSTLAACYLFSFFCYA